MELCFLMAEKSPFRDFRVHSDGLESFEAFVRALIISMGSFS